VACMCSCCRRRGAPRLEGGMLPRHILCAAAEMEDAGFERREERSVWRMPGLKLRGGLRDGRWEMPGEISLGTAVLACRGVAAMENAVFEGCCGWCVVFFWMFHLSSSSSREVLSLSQRIVCGCIIRIGVCFCLLDFERKGSYVKTGDIMSVEPNQS
jgi:hypothetical protein